MNKNIENFIESLLFASGRPLRLSEIRSILENEGIRVDLAEIKVGLNNLEERYAESSLELPALLVTTKTFLNDLNIKKISDLPTLPEKEEISPEEITDNAEINLEAG